MEVNQTVKNFLNKLAEDEELRGKLEVAAKRQDLAECALLSREAGFDFTQADLKCLEDFSASYQNGELSEAQLEMVSGGSVTFAIVSAVLLAIGLVGALAGAGTIGGALAIESKG
jgi:predicted ribosomally synthesized peptide with nif11-like leader